MNHVSLTGAEGIGTFAERPVGIGNEEKRVSKISCVSPNFGDIPRFLSVYLFKLLRI